MRLLLVMRIALIVLISGLLMGCASKAQTQAKFPKPKAMEPDLIKQLVAKLSSSNGYWAYGIFTPIDLPAWASPAEVISTILRFGIR